MLLKLKDTLKDSDSLLKDFDYLILINKQKSKNSGVLRKNSKKFLKKSSKKVKE
jgi:hypothetical protein